MKNCCIEEKLENGVGIVYMIGVYEYKITSLRKKFEIFTREKLEGIKSTEWVKSKRMTLKRFIDELDLEVKRLSKSNEFVVMDGSQYKIGKNENVFRKSNGHWYASTKCPYLILDAIHNGVPREAMSIAGND